MVKPQEERPRGEAGRYRRKQWVAETTGAGVPSASSFPVLTPGTLEGKRAGPDPPRQEGMPGQITGAPQVWAQPHTHAHTSTHSNQQIHACSKAHRQQPTRVLTPTRTHSSSQSCWHRQVQTRMLTSSAQICTDGVCANLYDSQDGRHYQDLCTKHT